MTPVLVNRRNDSPAIALPAIGAGQLANSPAIAFAHPRRVAHAAAGPRVQWMGPDEFMWRHVPVGVRDLPRELDGFRILHLSDFHTRGFWPAAYDTLLAGIAADPPDLILFTGDFVEKRTLKKQRPAIPHVHRLVEGLHAKLGVFGTLGNHDQYHFGEQLDGTKLELIDHQRRLIHLRNAAIELIGLPGCDQTDLCPKFLRALPPRANRTVRVVLSHYPDHLTRTRPLHPHLFLSGHTHGGQVCLPTGRPIITHCKLPKPYRRGIHHVDGTWLVVNHGLGYSGLPLRVLCPAEVIELTLRAE